MPLAASKAMPLASSSTTTHPMLTFSQRYSNLALGRLGSRGTNPKPKTLHASSATTKFTAPDIAKGGAMAHTTARAWGFNSQSQRVTSVQTLACPRVTKFDTRNFFQIVEKKS